MPDVRVYLNKDGLQELMHSDEMRACLQEYGEQVRSRCTAGSVGPEEYGVEVFDPGSRLVAKVYPDTAHAYYSNRKHKTVQKALWGG